MRDVLHMVKDSRNYDEKNITLNVNNFLNSILNRKTDYVNKITNPFLIIDCPRICN